MSKKLYCIKVVPDIPLKNDERNEMSRLSRMAARCADALSPRHTRIDGGSAFVPAQSTLPDPTAENLAQLRADLIKALESP